MCEILDSVKHSSASRECIDDTYDPPVLTKKKPDRTKKKKTWTRTKDVSPGNCLDLAFLVSFLTELLQHEELLQQVWQKFQLRKELCLSDLGFFYTDQSDQYNLRFNFHWI